MAVSGDGPDISKLINQVRRSLTERKDEGDYITPQPVSAVKLPTFAGVSMSSRSHCVLVESESVRHDRLG